MKFKGRKEDYDTGSEQQGFEEKKEKITDDLPGFIERNGKKVAYISLGVIAATVIFFLLKSNIQESNEEARQESALALSRVLPFYQYGDYQKALNGDPTVRVRGEEIIGLTDIVNKYEGTGAGKASALYAGNIFLNLDSLSEAKKYFNIASGSDSPTVVEGAYAGLGAVLQAEGKYEEAAAAFEKAYKKAVSDNAKSRYKYYAAVCWEKAGSKEKAAEIFSDIVVEHEFSEFASLAKQDFKRLGIEIK